MDHPTVSYCNEQAQAELALAGGSCSNSDQKRHLDRAVVFAHCSEEGRRVAELNGVSDVGAYRCSPFFPRGI